MSDWQPAKTYAVGDFLEPVSVAAFGYECTTAGKSGVNEPNWPTVNGATVGDGAAVWTARQAVVLTWTARALYKSGPNEPSWSVAWGNRTDDNNFQWVTRSQQITDPKCPHTKTALAIASKIYAPYRDVVRYCATDAPRDWSSSDDAGFVPSGLHAPTSPDATALGEYRGRLAIFTPSHLQLWTVDPDPKNITIYDSLAGFGTDHADAVVSVVDDLYFMTAQGVRSLSISATSTNLNSGDVGSGIDPLVVAKLAGPDEPMATYYPGNGQAWFVFGNEVYVYTKSRLGKIGAWSRYVFPWVITDATQLNGELYLRAGDDLYRLDENAVSDGGVTFEGVVWTPHLDLGSPGSLKFLESVDVTGYGQASISVGWNQADSSAYTPPYLMPEDSVPGCPAPIPVAGPSLAVKLTYAGGQAWQLNAMQLYLNDGGHAG